jgi:tRNA A-37 threonylcarbamoyl transferase component Bud32/sugar lactone lactonase YvrE
MTSSRSDAENAFPAEQRGLSPSEAARVDEICDRFEAAWKAGGRPRIEDFSSARAEPERSNLLRELIALDVAYRQRTGEAPTAADYLARFPAIGPARLQQMVEPPAPTVTLAPLPADPVVTAESGPGAGGGNGAPGDPDLRRPARVSYFGDYELLRVLGHGAMGVVYKARQQSRNRLVAVKMIRAGLWAGDAEVRRFRNEAEAVANLDHPQIVTIYEVGEHEGRHYVSMKLIDGPSLADVLPRYTADPHAVARLVAEAARAVHHAHQRGILHRDLKPSNILLDSEGHPHVTDFGLARRIEGASELSVSGSILGTPAYMSPEQASGRRTSVTTAADVYGLGAVLYATLTGQAPFSGETVVETLDQVRERAPGRPSAVNRLVDRDLETICLKCLEKDPRKRYESAAGPAEELERWLRGEPILARQAGTWERVWKWSRRQPTAAALVGLSGVALLTLVGLSVALVYQSRLRAAYAAKDAALAHELTFLYENRIVLAERALNDNTPQRVEQLLDECPKDHRNWEWNYLKRQCHAELMTEARTIPASGSRVSALAFSPDGQRLVEAGSDRALRLREIPSGQLRATWNGHTEVVRSVAFSPDGKHVASGAGDWRVARGVGEVHIWDAVTGELIHARKAHQACTSCVRFSPDGRRLVSVGGETGTAGQEIILWDVATGTRVRTIANPKGGTRSVAYSPDGRQIAAGGGNIIDTWDVERGERRARFEGHSIEINGLAFSPDGRRLISAAGDGTLRVWDAATGRPIQVLFADKYGNTSLALSPDGRRIASAGFDAAIKIWDIDTGQQLITLRGHRGVVHGVAFSPDGRWIASSDENGLVKLWDGSPIIGAAR